MMDTAGATVISKNGEPVLAGPGKYCMVRNPNNLFLELIQLPEAKL